MFDIVNIHLHNFKSYGGEHYFQFPTEAGLYFLTGENKANTRLGPNGVGKTSFIDSINWCLYGRSTRGLRATEIITWGEKSASVEIHLTISETNYAIKRSQAPNSLTINGEVVEQHELTSLLRMSPEAFNFAVVLPQFGLSFIDLSAAEKLTLFSSVMNLDFWLDKSKLAGELAEESNREIIHIDKQVAIAGSKAEGLREDIEALIEKSNTFKVESQKIIAQLEVKLAWEIETNENLKATLSATTVELKRQEAEILSLEEGYKVLREEMNGVTEKRQKYKATFLVLIKRLKEIEIELEDVSNLVNLICPTCKQPVTPEHADLHSRHLDKENVETILLLNKEQSRINKADEIIKRVEKLTSEHSRNLAKVRDARIYIAAEEARKKTSLNAGKQAQQELKDRIKQEIGKENPFFKMIDKKKSELAETEEMLVAKKLKLEKLKAELEATHFWVNGFKRLRLYVVEEAMRGLEVEVNNSLASLGLIDWNITFDIEREKKTGGFSKGFNTFVKNSRYNKPVRLEAWSGGETQRLRLAGDLGLANLILERAGLVSHIEFHDEPSEHLSPEGIQDMVETLADRALTLNKKVWLVDHSVISYGGFAGVLIAKMNENGYSSLEFQT